jgi:hypothetical protein
VRKLTGKHVLCIQLGAVRQWYHIGHPDINKQHVQLFFFVTATSGSGNGGSPESDDLYKVHRNFFLQLESCLTTHLLLYDIQTHIWCYFLFGLKSDKNMTADFCISSTNSHQCCIIYINITYSFPPSLFPLILSSWKGLAYVTNQGTTQLVL